MNIPVKLATHRFLEWIRGVSRPTVGSAFPRLEGYVRDIRFSFRGLRKRPAFAVAAVLTLTVGTGMTTTMFTLVDAVILRPLPGENAQGMVYLALASRDGGEVVTLP